MTEKKNILIIIGSASKQSANEKLMDLFVEMTKDFFNVVVFKELKMLPHFDPELSVAGTPEAIIAFRKDVEAADGVVICTPEYVFSIPSGLKNAIEWCVSTLVFSDKPVGLVTASAHGQKGHDELQLIMRTVGAKFTEATTLLIPGIRGKIDEQGELSDIKTTEAFGHFVDQFRMLVAES